MPISCPQSCAAIVLFASLLDERERRLCAGLESLKCGWGGDTRIASLLGIDAATVARGRKQLLAGEVGARTRAPPRWRAAFAKTPEVIATTEAQLKYDVAGDPISGARWTNVSPRRSSQNFATLDIQVCPRPVSSRTSTIGYA